MPNSAGPLIVRRQPPLKRHPLRVETVALVFLFRPRIEKPCGPKFRASSTRHASGIPCRFLGNLEFDHRSNRLPSKAKFHAPGLHVARSCETCAYKRQPHAHHRHTLDYTWQTWKTRANKERVRACGGKTDKIYITHGASQSFRQ
jgi:hypothetical protein